MRVDLKKQNGVRVQHVPHPKNYKEWRCSGCGKKLGILDKEHKVLRLKSKDWYVYVQGGAVLVICRNCAKFNRLVDSDFPESKDITLNL